MELDDVPDNMNNMDVKETLDMTVIRPILNKLTKSLNLPENCIDVKEFPLVLVTLQIKLSKIFTSLFDLQAGILTMREILDYNKQVTPEEL